VTRAVTRRIPALQPWWLIWVAAGACIFSCGLILGLASIGDPQGARWFGQILARPFGGRERVSVLIIGVDATQGKGLADTIIATVISPRTGEIAGLSIPRDSRVEIPRLGIRKINEAHSFGGRPRTIEAVELLLGMPFDYYVEVDVAGVADLVDVVGGVDIDVEKRMYYRDRSQDLLIDLQPGFQHLTGEQAVGYVRFRHDARGDLGRIQRQRTFIRAAVRQVLAPENIRHVSSLASVFVETVDTNLQVKDVLALKGIIEDVGADAIHIETLPGNPRIIRGQSMLELDAGAVQQAVNRVLLGQGLDVTVLNGTTINGLAARTAALLEKRGCHIVEVGNAEHKTPRTVVIDHRGQTARAERVASWLGRGVISVAPDGEAAADVTVIAGPDMSSIVP
jgi:LCP family protein required for cell wall assembly